MYPKVDQCPYDSKFFLTSRIYSNLRNQNSRVILSFFSLEDLKVGYIYSDVTCPCSSMRKELILSNSVLPLAVN